MEKRKLKNMIVNFGPQHPAAHGVLRLIIESIGEKIISVDSHIGLLHRGTEKLIETKQYIQGLPYFDRLDYVSMMAQEYTYSVGIENLLQLKIPFKAKILRMLFCEVTRILNHLLAVTTHALDVGGLTPFLWGFEVREILMEFYERACGARLHSAYVRPGGVARDVPVDLIADILNFTKMFNYRLNEMEDLLNENRVRLARLKEIGIVPLFMAHDWGFSGVMLRGSGISWDLRKSDGYDLYKYFKNFVIPKGINGDCYDRYLIRVEEMRQANDIMYRLSGYLLGLEEQKLLFASVSDNKIIWPKRMHMKRNMEALIHHFKLVTEGCNIDKEETYVSVEAPKGEFGVGLRSDDTARPYRCRIKSPGFLHLQGLDWMATDLLLSDLVAIIGTQDLVFGEVDR